MSDGCPGRAWRPVVRHAPDLDAPCAASANRRKYWTSVGADPRPSVPHFSCGRAPVRKRGRAL
eukprot:8575235-Pyramimonas_sp.AAC.1